jgi:hypothetical protein
MTLVDHLDVGDNSSPICMCDGAFRPFLLFRLAISDLSHASLVAVRDQTRVGLVRCEQSSDTSTPFGSLPLGPSVVRMPGGDENCIWPVARRNGYYIMVGVIFQRQCWAVGYLLSLVEGTAQLAAT